MAFRWDRTTYCPDHQSRTAKRHEEGQVTFIGQGVVGRMRRYRVAEASPPGCLQLVGQILGKRAGLGRHHFTSLLKLRRRSTRASVAGARGPRPPEAGPAARQQQTGGALGESLRAIAGPLLGAPANSTTSGLLSKTIRTFSNGARRFHRFHRSRHSAAGKGPRRNCSEEAFDGARKASGHQEVGPPQQSVRGLHQ